MSFADREGSRLNGRPLHLYLFEYADGARRLAYTNITQPYTHGGIDYLPLAIGHSEIVASGKLDRAGLQVTAPSDSDLARLFREGPPSSVIGLIVRQGHVDEPEFKVCWAGKITGGQVERGSFTATGEPISMSMRRPGLTRDWQTSCPHLLYGPQCRANKAAATITRTTAAVSGANLTLATNWETDGRKDKYVGGMVEWVDGTSLLHRRAIIRRNGATQVVMASAMPGLGAGQSVSLILGCNHLSTDCESLHDNIVNFGGQEQIPTKNPVGLVYNYY